MTIIYLNYSHDLIKGDRVFDCIKIMIAYTIEFKIAIKLNYLNCKGIKNKLK